MASAKIIIYQIFTRLYGNLNTTRKEGGTLQENGCGKMNDFTPTALKHIRDMGVSHIWYTGIIRHATQTDYTAYGIPKNHPAIVKGQAGSPYAITVRRETNGRCHFIQYAGQFFLDEDIRIQTNDVLIFLQQIKRFKPGK